LSIHFKTQTGKYIIIMIKKMLHLHIHTCLSPLKCQYLFAY
jgi:hypothetical protein